MESNTDSTTDLVASGLPAETDITPQALLYALYAADTEYTRSVTDAAISDAFAELTTAENKNPHATGDPLPDGLDRPDIDGVDSDPDSFEESYDIDQSPPRVLYDSIAHSWELNQVNDQMMVDYHAAVTPYLHHSEPIHEVLPPEIMMDGDETPTRSLDPAFQQRVVVLSLLHLHHDIMESNFSEREGIIYHLSARYTTDEMADIIASEFGGSVSAGSIRKSISRIKDKLNQATFMTETYSVDTVSTDVDLSPSPFSLFSEDQLSEVTQFVSGMLASQTASEMEKSWEIGKGVTFVVEVRPPDEIAVRVYCDVDCLPSPATVDIDHIEDAEMVQTPHDDEGLSSLPSMCEDFQHTMGDIRLVIESALRRVDRIYDPEHPQPLNLLATQAYDSDEYESGGFVGFVGWVHTAPMEE